MIIIKRFFSICVCVVICFALLSIPCFAVDWSFQLADVTRDTTNFNVTKGSYNGLSGTRLTAGTTAGTIAFFYPVANTHLLAGQTYTVSFQLSRSSGSNAGFQCYLSDDASLGNTYKSVFDSQLSSMVSPDSNWHSVNFSFVYDGSTYLIIFLGATSLGSNNTLFSAWFSEIQLTRYNPNAELESHVDEGFGNLQSNIDENFSVQQSIQDEQNSVQNSILDEQNSLQEDIRAGLFDDGTSYTITEPEFGSALTVINDGMEEFQRGAINSSTPKIQRGLMAFSALFTMIYDVFVSSPSTSWIPACMWIVAGLSVTALILGNLSQVAAGVSLGRNKDYSRDYYFDNGKTRTYTHVSQKGNVRNISQRSFKRKR